MTSDIPCKGALLVASYFRAFFILPEQLSPL
jgi:hypothetical protein